VQAGKVFHGRRKKKKETKTDNFIPNTQGVWDVTTFNATDKRRFEGSQRLV